MPRVTLFLAVAVLVVLTAISGCAKKEDFALKVNDKIIPKKTYEDKMNALKTQLEKQGIDFNSEQGKATLETVKNDVIEGLIGTELIRQVIEKNKWDINDPKVAQQIKELKEQIPDKDFQKWLDEQAMTEGEVAEYFTFTTNAVKDVAVTDQEIRQFFESNYAQYGGQEEQVRARHILVEKAEEALAVIQELKAGADFAELAKKKSIEPAAQHSGGDLNYFSKGDMVPEFEQAAFSQKVGVISEKPVKTDFGYHVILVEDHKQAVVPDFEKAKDSVKADAQEYAENMKIQSYYYQLRQEAKIEYAADLKPKNA